MPVSADQIAKAKTSGKILGYVEQMAQVCNLSRFPFFLGLTILEKESNGRNIWGADAGGALSGYKGPVTKDGYDIFAWLVRDKGQTSNGVGPMQLTHPSLLWGPGSIESLGWKAYLPGHNIHYAVDRILKPKYDKLRQEWRPRKAFRLAATAYNGNPAYGDDAVVRADQWLALLGSQDLPTDFRSDIPHPSES